METKAFHASISLIFKIFARAELIVCRWKFFPLEKHIY